MERISAQCGRGVGYGFVHVYINHCRKWLISDYPLGEISLFDNVCNIMCWHFCVSLKCVRAVRGLHTLSVSVWGVALVWVDMTAWVGTGCNSTSQYNLAFRLGCACAIGDCLWMKLWEYLCVDFWMCVVVYMCEWVQHIWIALIYLEQRVMARPVLQLCQLCQGGSFLAWSGHRIS